MSRSLRLYLEAKRLEGLLDSAGGFTLNADQQYLKLADSAWADPLEAFLRLLQRLFELGPRWVIIDWALDSLVLSFELETDSSPFTHPDPELKAVYSAIVRDKFRLMKICERDHVLVVDNQGRSRKESAPYDSVARRIVFWYRVPRSAWRGFFHLRKEKLADLNYLGPRLAYHPVRLGRVEPSSYWTDHAYRPHRMAFTLVGGMEAANIAITTASSYLPFVAKTRQPPSLSKLANPNFFGFARWLEVADFCAPVLARFYLPTTPGEHSLILVKNGVVIGSVPFSAPGVGGFCRHRRLGTPGRYRAKVGTAARISLWHAGKTLRALRRDSGPYRREYLSEIDKEQA